MRFKVHGQPAIEGAYEGGLAVIDGSCSAFWTDVSTRDGGKSQVFSRDEHNAGYYADEDTKIEYLSGGAEPQPEPGLTEAEIDAKLVAYANQRMAELVGTGRGETFSKLFHSAEGAASFHVGEAFLTIYKELTN